MKRRPVVHRDMRFLLIQPDIAQLTEFANRFRAAILRIPTDIRPIGMREFPNGACGDTALLMGAYLADQGIQGFAYVCGTRGEHADGSWHSHAWLQHRRLVIDITADQFSDMPDAIIVSDTSKWHKQFRVERHQDADFREWSGMGIAPLHSMYEKILRAIESP